MVCANRLNQLNSIFNNDARENSRYRHQELILSVFHIDSRTRDRLEEKTLETDKIQLTPKFIATHRDYNITYPSPNPVKDIALASVVVVPLLILASTFAAGVGYGIYKTVEAVLQIFK